MSALPIVIPEFSAVPGNSHWSHRSAVPAADVRASIAATPTSTPGSWKLTDRGIAAVMLLTAVILTAALAVIGITALRITSADYDTGLQESQQAQR